MATVTSAPAIGRPCSSVTNPPIGRPGPSSCVRVWVVLGLACSATACGARPTGLAPASRPTAARIAARRIVFTFERVMAWRTPGTPARGRGLQLPEGPAPNPRESWLRIRPRFLAWESVMDQDAPSVSWMDLGIQARDEGGVLATGQAALEGGLEGR